MPVIDFHFHISHYEQIQPWVLEWAQTTFGQGDLEEYIRSIMTPDGVRRFLRENGVDYAVALAEMSPITTGMVTNEFVAEFCRDIEVLIPFCNVNPALETRVDESLERYVTEMGFRGVKLYPSYQHFYPNDTRLYPLYARAQEMGIPVMMHTGSSVFRGARLKYGDPLWLDDVCVDFPDLTVIMAHSGRGFWYDRAFFLSRLHRNLYMEISGLPPKRLLEYFPELERNADKVIFGSDWPGMPHVGRNVRLVRELPLRDGTIDKILGGNAARILGFG